MLGHWLEMFPPPLSLSTQPPQPPREHALTQPSQPSETSEPASPTARRSQPLCGNRWRAVRVLKVIRALCFRVPLCPTLCLGPSDSGGDLRIAHKSSSSVLGQSHRRPDRLPLLRTMRSDGRRALTPPQHHSIRPRTVQALSKSS